MEQAGEVVALDGGSYRLCELLAESAYGKVWRACSPAGTEVALKLVNRVQMARAPEAMQQRWIDSASREMTFLRSLAPWDARHLVRLLDSGSHNTMPAMALELLGPDLNRHLAARRNAGLPLDLGQVLDWLGQVNQALARVHQYGWRHLDLKPANLLLDPATGGVKLADFGTSELHGGAPARSYAGSANWQAPEQFFPTTAQTWDTDARSDYFALGSMFYFLVTGGLQLRFGSQCGQAWREHQARAPQALLERYHGEIPPTLCDDEAELFALRISGQLCAADVTWTPGDSAAGGAALALLRCLLAPARGDRPQHAIHISRMLGAVRAAMPGQHGATLLPLPVTPLRPAPARRRAA